MKTFDRYLLIFAVGLLCFSTFTTRASAHNSVFGIAVFVNETTSEGNMYLNGVPVKRDGIPIPTHPSSNPSHENLLSLDDIQQRVKNLHNYLVLWFVAVPGSKLEGKGACMVLSLDVQRLPPGEAHEYKQYAWHITSDMFMPLDQLVQKSHAELLARGADFGFEPVVEMDNRSSAGRNVLLNGKLFQVIPPGENCAVSRSDLAGLGDRFGLSMNYGKEKKASDGNTYIYQVDGGKVAVYSREHDGNWPSFPAFVTTDKDMLWSKIPQGSKDQPALVIKNKSASWNVIVVGSKKPFPVISTGGNYDYEDSGKPGARTTINLVYTAQGKNLGGEFHIYQPSADGKVYGSPWVVESMPTAPLLAGP